MFRNIHPDDYSAELITEAVVNRERFANEGENPNWTPEWEMSEEEIEEAKNFVPTPSPIEEAYVDDGLPW